MSVVSKKQIIKRVTVGCLVSLSFLVLNYGLIFLVAKPVIQFVSSSIQLLLLTDAPTFDETPKKMTIQKNISNHQGEINSSQIQFPKCGENYGEIKISGINLKIPLYFGDSEAILREGAGQYMGSVFPGERGTTLVGGHNTGEFAKLINIQQQEQIDIQTSYGNYTYSVMQKIIANKADPVIAKELRQRESSKLILYTCYPIDSIGLTNQRLFVTVDLISGPKINENN